MRPDFLKLYPQVTISQVCYHTTLRCSAQEPILDQIRFVDICLLYTSDAADEL